MAGPIGEVCRECYFMEVVRAETEDEYGEGLCHRFPLTLRPLDSEGTCSPVSVILSDESEDWCGEFKPLKSEAA